MKHLGDITKINGADIEPVWCISGGSPCQDLSVAGKRKGLRHADLGDEETTRSGLFIEQIRIVKEMRERDRNSGRADELTRPRFMVWENVPGAFSSNFSEDGGDFGAVLEEIVRIREPEFSLPKLPKKQKWTKSGAICGDGWSVAWRTHDAQYWGVPQRRRRISLVADFGGECAGEILFECKSLSGNTDEGTAQGKEAPGDTANGSGVNDRVAEPVLLETNQNHATIQTDGVCTALPASMGMGGGYVPMITDRVAYCVDMGAGKSSCDVLENKAPTLATTNYGEPAVAYGWPLGFRAENTRTYEETATTLCNGTRPGFTTGVCYGLDRASFNQGRNAKFGFAVEEELSPTVIAKGPNAVCEPVPYTLQIRSGCEGGGKGALVQENKVAALTTVQTHTVFQPVSEPVAWDGRDVSPTLTSQYAGGNQRMPDKANFNCVIESHVYDNHPADSRVTEAKGCVQALTGRMGTGGGNIPFAVQRMVRWIVRRLTPMECERLQGYPDHWTDIGDWVDTKGKKHKGDADSPRYKALGNSIALPFWHWMFLNMARHLPEGATLGSLFDGIGGFPLCWESIHGRGTARWASEIEEFPIAVTKIRFPEEDENNE